MKKGSLSRLALLASLLVLVCPAALADNSPITGIPPLSSIAGGPFDTLNLANLNTHFSIPVFSRPGAGLPFSYALSYDSLVWVPSGGTSSWQPVENWGWRAVTEAATGYVTYGYESDEVCYYYKGRVEYEGGDTTSYSDFAYHDSEGGLHPFNGTATIIIKYGNDPANHCTATKRFPITNAVATDNSGYILTTDALSATVNSRSGLTFRVPPVQSPTGAGSVTDPNGNVISTSSTGVITDTLGTALWVTGAYPAPVTYQYSAPGRTASVTVTYRSYTVATQFGVSGVSEYPPTGQYLVDRVTLPDSSFYQFYYEATGTGQPYYGGGSGPVTARIAGVILPTGGALTYTYGSTNSMMADGSPSVLTRNLDGGTWTYNRAYQNGPSTPQQTYTNIFDPAGNEIYKQFSGLYETFNITRQGTTTILDQTSTCYNGNWTSCDNAVVAAPITYKARYAFGNCSWPCSYAVYTSTYNGYGLQTQELDYDYGASGSLGPIANVVYTNYNTALCSAANICDRPSSVQVEDGAYIQKALTNYSYDIRGNATQVSRWVSGSTYLTTSNTYNANGTLLTSTDPNGTTTTYSYAGNSCSGAFPTGINVGPLTTTFGYNCTAGVVTSVTDPNNATVSTGYTDPYFWRAASTTDQLGNVTYFNYYGVRNAPTTIVTAPGQIETMLSWPGSTVDVLTTPDSYGRAWLRQQKTPQSTYDTVQYVYDLSGRLQQASLPFNTTVAGPHSNYQHLSITGYDYDGLGRSTSIFTCNGVDCNGTNTTFSYNLNDVTISTGPGQTFSKALEYDVLGRLLSVCEVSGMPGTGPCGQNTPQTGYRTSYTYDPLGDLTGATQGAQTRSFAYDGLGRTLRETNPENGATSYAYDSDTTCGTSTGDKVRRYDAAGNTTCYAWDILHRLTQVSYPSGPNTTNMPTKVFVYDYSTPYGIPVNNPLGRLTAAYTNRGTTYYSGEAYSYNARGNETDLYETTPNSANWYHVQESYFPNGSMASMQGFTGTGISPPFSHLFTYSLDGEGRPYSMVDTTNNNNPIWTSTSYNPASQPTAVVQAAGGGETFTYDPYSGGMKQWQSTAGSQRQTGNLTWNANGTLGTLAITDAFNAANNQTCTNGYDDLARLTRNACTGGPGWSQSFSYDRYGNIYASGSFQATYDAQTNRVTNLGFSYDADGNVLRDNLGDSFVYDADGRQVQLTVGTTATTTIFDAFDRAVELNSTTGHKQIIYAPSGAKFAYMSGQTLQKYIFPMVAGMQAVHNGDGTGYYVHTDWLGSSRLGVTGGGTVRYDRAYAPFGQAYAELNSDPTNRSFTGQTEDTTSGIYDFQFRQQSSNQGRWFVPDPAGLAAVDTTNPQSWNRYAYVGNQPLNTTDLMGLFIVDCVWDGCPIHNAGAGGGGYYGGLAFGLYIDGIQQTTFNTSGLGSNALGVCPAGLSGCIVGADNKPYQWKPVKCANGDGNCVELLPSGSSAPPLSPYDKAYMDWVDRNHPVPVSSDYRTPKQPKPPKAPSKPKPPSKPWCTDGYNFFCELIKNFKTTPGWVLSIDPKDDFGAGADPPPLEVP